MFFRKAQCPLAYLMVFDQVRPRLFTPYRWSIGGWRRDTAFTGKSRAVCANHARVLRIRWFDSIDE
jgi:hypothetical protein